MTTIEAKKQIEEKLAKYFATSGRQATDDQIYKAVSMSVRDILLKKKQVFNNEVRAQKKKRVYYLCMEFLLGRNLRNNLSNLGLEAEYAAAIKEMGHNLSELYELEADPGLGNGGLGRLAACFMDSLASRDYPALGFSLKYEYGLFKQRIVDNEQAEMPDVWLGTGEVWMVPRSDKTFSVKFGGTVHEYWDNGRLKIEHNDATVLEAAPYDLMISGGGSDGVSVLRLWKARSAQSFDMKSFSQGDYYKAMKADADADTLCKVLYPTDDHYAGKQLRLNQQYFLVSASLQNIIKDHLKVYPNLSNLHKKVAIHINDTHPALAVPELMRLLVDEYDMDWDEAWHITVNTMGYTNHTVLAEALEKWSEELVAGRLPRIYMIIREINRRFTEHARQHFEAQKIEKMSIINHGLVHMANLSVIGSHSINGVAQLHSDIIRDTIFSDFNKLYPGRFTNVTNGIAHRRWLTQANPELDKFIKGLIGDGFYKEASELKKLNGFTGDKQVLKKLEAIKRSNKVRFCNYMKQSAGVDIDPDTRFDVQIKRLHEYKRQLMNVLKIVHLYSLLKEDPDMEMTPQTFIFGAKAAPGYYHAKRIISLICNLSAEIQRNPKIRAKLNVCFVENYNVTRAEVLIPASEVSEQISLAGKEASGTSNMKFMMNGALTIGTLDGANVEIYDSVGDDNFFLFGLRAHEVDNLLRSGYFASYFYSSNPVVKSVVDSLRTGFNGVSFADITNYLVGTSGLADPYMCQVDFNDYLRAHTEMDKRYRNRESWNRSALINIAESGRFAADRSIEEYAKNIWSLQKVVIKDGKES